MTKHPRIRKAVFPVAGLGTRFLPATKTVPKEMLPIVDKPLIQYAVDEAIEAGCDTLVFVTNRYKHAVADYFDKAYELEQKLERSRQARAAGADPQRAAVACARGVRHPGRGAGTGPCGAVREAGHRRRAVRGAAAGRPDLEPWRRRAQADGRPGRRHRRQRDRGAGRAARADRQLRHRRHRCLRRSGPGGSTAIVEKPAPEDAPSTLAVVGRYVLDPPIFDLLEAHRAGCRWRDPADRCDRRAVAAKAGARPIASRARASIAAPTSA